MDSGPRRGSRTTTRRIERMRPRATLHLGTPIIRMVRRMMKKITYIVAPFIWASPVAAEVMDKELSRGDIWMFAVIIGLLSLAVGSLKPRLVWPMIPVSYLFGPTFAWTEWYTPDVGPVIAREAGRCYGLHASLGMTFIFAANICAWVLGTLRLRHKPGAPDQRSILLLQRQALSFFFLVSYGTAFLLAFSYSGFPVTVAIRTSIPLLFGYILSAISGVLAIWACMRAHRPPCHLSGRELRRRQ